MRCLALTALFFAACSNESDDTDTSVEPDTSDADTSDIDTEGADGQAELVFVVSGEGTYLTDVQIRLDDEEPEEGFSQALLNWGAVAFAPGTREDPFVIDAGEHTFSYQFTHVVPVCQDPPACTQIDDVPYVTEDTLTFEVAAGETWAATALTAEGGGPDAFEVYETAWVSAVELPAGTDRGVLVVHGRSDPNAYEVAVSLPEVGSEMAAEHSVVQPGGFAVLGVATDADLNFTTGTSESVVNAYSYGPLEAGDLRYVMVYDFYTSPSVQATRMGSGRLGPAD